jgi:hypothetical protein
MTINGLHKLDNIYKQLKTSAYWTNTHLNSRFATNNESATEHYAQFLTEKLKRPTVANIVMKDIQKEHPITFPLIYILKKEKLEKTPKIRNLLNSIIKQDKNLYPKTSKLRFVLLEDNRFNLNSIKPKLFKLKKFVLKLKSII